MSQVVADFLQVASLVAPYWVAFMVFIGISAIVDGVMDRRARRGLA